MKKYNIKVNDQKFLVEVEQIDAENLNVKIDNNIYEISVDEINDFTKLKTEKTKYVSLGNTSVLQNSNSPKNDNAMYSPLSGLIVKVAVKVGDSIKNGDLICTIEAMKMESEIYSSVEGTVKKIYVQENKSVLSNDIIIEI